MSMKEFLSKLIPPRADIAKTQARKFTRSKFGNVMFFVFLFAFGAFSVLPLVYSITTSFKPLDELMIFPPKIFKVSRPTIANYLVLPDLISSLSLPLSRYIFNSLFVSIVGTVLHVIASGMAAFVLSKTDLKFKNIIFMIIQYSLLFNGYTLGVPRYLVYNGMHIIDTYFVYILPFIPSAMGVFLMKQYMDSGIPDTLLEAARIDGAGVFCMYWRLVMPLTRPAWMTLLLFAFQGIWSTTPASGTIFSEELKTLPYVMSSITDGGTARAGSAMAATVILMLPPIIVYFITQGNVSETMSKSGIKD